MTPPRSDGRALDILDQHGRLIAGQLAAESGLSTGAVTALLARLERVGYVHRLRDEADRRRVLVELTDLARTRTREIRGPLAGQSDRLLDRYSDAELAPVRDLLRYGREILAGHLERIKALGETPAR